MNSQTLISYLSPARLILAFGIGLLSVLVYTSVPTQTCDQVCQWEQSQAHFYLGQYYFNHDEDPDPPYDLARAHYHFTKAIEHDPWQHQLLWYQRGRVSFIQSDFDNAISDFEEQVNRFGESIPAVYYMLGLTHGYRARRDAAETDWSQAEAYFKTFLTLSPDAPWTRVDLAWVYFAQGKYSDMKPILERGLQTHPDNAWLLNMYGLAVMNTADDAQEALSYFYQARAAAADLTAEDWGLIYPGNNPALWEAGLAEFRSTIEKNINLVE